MTKRHCSIAIAILSAMLVVPMTGCGKGKKPAGDAFTRGVDARDKGKWAEAVKEFTEAVKDAPDDLSLQFQLGKALVRNKSYEQAIVQLNNLITKVADSTDPEKVMLLAQAYLEISRAEMGLAAKAEAAKSPAQQVQAHYVAAEQHCRKAMEKMPDLGSGYIVLSDIYTGRQEFDKALAEIDKAIANIDKAITKIDNAEARGEKAKKGEDKASLVRDLADAYNKKADLLYRLKNPEQALGACIAGMSKLQQRRNKELEAISEKDDQKRKDASDPVNALYNPGIFKLGSSKGYILSRQPGRTNEAITVYKELLEEDESSNVRAVALKPEEAAKVHRQLGELYLEDRKWKEARDEAEKLQTVQSGAVQAAYIRGRAALGEASEAKDESTRQRLLTTAINELSTMSGQPFVQGLFFLGQAYRYKGGRDEQALTEFRKALSHVDDQTRYLEPGIRVGIADVLARKTEYDAAIDQCKQAIAIHKSNVEAHQVLARIYQQTNQISLAQKELEAIAGENATASPAAHIEFAQLLLIRRQYDKALEKCKEAIELSDGKDARAFFVLGHAHRALGQQHEAVAAFEQALRLDPGFPQAYMSLAQTYIETDQKGKAVELLKKCMADQPTAPQPPVGLAEIAEGDKDVDGAIQYYRNALARDPKHLPAYSVARLYLIKGQLDEAIQRWREAIAVIEEAKARIPQYQINLSLALMLAGKPDEAIQQIQEVKKLFPDQKGQYSIYEILIYLGSGQYDKAQEVLANATDVSPNHKLPVIQFITLYKENPVAGKKALVPFTYAAVEMNEGRPPRYRQAILYLEQARQILPNSLLLLSNLGLAHVRLGQLEKFGEMANEMIKLDPQYAIPYIYLGMLAQQSGKIDDAIANFEKAAERDDKEVEARFLLAQLKVQNERYGDALKLMNEVLAIDPENDTAYAMKMEIHHRNNDKSEFEKDVNEILKRDPKSTLGLRAKAYSNIEDRRYDDAIRVCDDALAADHNDTSFYSLKAKALVKRNRPARDNTPSDVDQAVAVLEKAIQINDLNSSLYVDLADIFRGDARNVSRAIYILKQGLARIPKSPAITMSLIDIYTNANKLKEAQELLAEIDISGDDPTAKLLKYQVDFYAALNQKDETERSRQLGTLVANLRTMATGGNRDQAYQAQMLLGRIYYQANQQQPTLAKQAYDEARKLKEDRSEPINALVPISFRQSSFDESSRLLERLCNPDMEPNPLNYARLAISRQMERKLDDAIKAANKAVELLDEAKQQSDIVRIALANVLLDSGKVEDAIAAIRKTSKMDPERLTGYEQLARNLAATDRTAVASELNQAIFYSISRHVDLVPKHYKAALDLAKSTNIFLMSALADSYLGAGNADDAAELYKDIAKQQPDYFKVQTYLGDIYQALGKFTDAIAAYEQAVEHFPKEAWISATLALLYHRLDRFPEAQKYCQKSLQIAPDDRRVINLLGETYERQGLIDQALGCYEKVIKLAPNDRQSAFAYNNAAWNYATKKDPNLRVALGYAMKARELVPEMPAVGDTLGWVLYLSKDFKRAKDELRIAAAGMKDNGSVQYHYAKVLAELNENEQACQILDSIANLDFPEKAQAQELLATLRGVRK